MLAAAKKNQKGPAGPTDQISIVCSRSFLALVPFLWKKRFQKGSFVRLKISDLAVAQNLLVSSLAGSWKLKRRVRRRRRRNPGRLKMTTGGPGTPAPA